MIIIHKFNDTIDMIEYFFAINPDNIEYPFLFGAKSTDPELPHSARWAAASSFCVETLNELDSTMWKDWRASLTKIGCTWVIPVIEEALSQKDSQYAVDEILRIAKT